MLAAPVGDRNVMKKCTIFSGAFYVNVMYQKALKEFAKIVAQSKSMPTREESLNFYHVHLVGPEMRWSKKAIWSGWKALLYHAYTL